MFDLNKVATVFYPSIQPSSRHGETPHKKDPIRWGQTQDLPSNCNVKLVCNVKGAIALVVRIAY